MRIYLSAFALSVGLSSSNVQGFIPNKLQWATSSSSPSSITQQFASSTADLITTAATTENNDNNKDYATTTDDDISLEFPPPLSQIDQLKRAAIFWTSALPVVANYYGLIGNIKLKQLLEKDALTEEEIEVRPENHGW